VLILNIRTPVKTKLAETTGRLTPTLPLQVNGAYSAPSSLAIDREIASDGTYKYAAEKHAGRSVSCRTVHETVCM